MYLIWAPQGCKIPLLFQIYENISYESPVLKPIPSSVIQPLTVNDCAG